MKNGIIDAMRPLQKQSNITLLNQRLLTSVNHELGETSVLYGFLKKSSEMYVHQPQRRANNAYSQRFSYSSIHPCNICNQIS